MNSLKKTLTTFLTVLVSAGIIAQEQFSMSLREAQDYAATHAFGVKSALATQESAELTADGLLGIGLPQVKANVQYLNYIEIPTTLLPAEFTGGAPGEYTEIQFGTPHNTNVTLSATQLLFDGSWLVGMQAAKTYSDLQQKQVQKSEIDVKNDVANSYHLAVIAAKNYELTQETIRTLKGMLAETKALYEGGFAEEQDVQQLQLSLNDFENRQAYSEQQVKLSNDLLKFTMGMPMNYSLTLTDNPDALVAQVWGYNNSTGFNPESNIDVILAQGGLQMQQLSLKNEKAKLLPQAGLFYNLQTQSQRNEFSVFNTTLPWYPNQSWGLQINIPIFSGLSKVKSIDKANVEVRKMNDMLTMTREAVALEYNNARTELEFAEKNYHLTEDNMNLANDILRKTNIRYKEGMASSFEVSQNTSQVLTAQGNYVRAMLQLLNAKSRWDKAIGNVPVSAH